MRERAQMALRAAAAASEASQRAAAYSAAATTAASKAADAAERAASAASFAQVGIIDWLQTAYTQTYFDWLQTVPGREWRCLGGCTGMIERAPRLC